MSDELDDFTEPVIVEFYLGVTKCPPGNAKNCNEIQNRGHNDWPLVTVWPKNQAFRLTTGAESGSTGLGLPVPVQLNATEQRMAQILGLNELELGIFLREWTPAYSSDKRSKEGEYKSIELGPEGRPKNLDDLLYVYNQAGKVITNQHRVKPPKKKEERIEVEPKTPSEQDQVLEKLGEIDPKDYTEAVEILRLEGFMLAVGFLRFHADKKFEMNKAVELVNLIKWFEQI